MAKAKFKKVSEWIEQSSMSEFMLIENEVERETAKAIAFKGFKWNVSATDQKPASIWVPKSQATAVVNDYYNNAPEKCYLIPSWLFSSKCDDGFSFCYEM